MKYKSTFFALISSALIIGFLFLVNYTTSWNHPWFIYPTFAVLWWPLGVFFGTNKGYKAFSIVGSLYIAGFFYVVNMITSPAFPWFIFPAFCVIWWPLGVILGSKKPKLFSIVATAIIIGFFYVLNMITSPAYPWFIFPAFGILWWPMSLIICGAKKYKLYSVVASLLTIGFFALVNYITSPNYIWFYYPSFAIIWWPLSMFFAKKKTIKLYSVIMSLCMIGFLALINYMNTPNYIWYPYAIFHFLWWPIVMFLGDKAKSLGFSIVGAIAIIAYYVTVYFLQTPNAHPWFWYIVLPSLWWPVCTAFKDKVFSLKFLTVSLIIFTAYYTVLNLILSPTYFWVINIYYPLAWAVIGTYFGTRKKFFALSVAGTAITIIYFSVLNYITSPNYIWAVYPIFAILWWPLSLYFFKYRKTSKEITS